MNFIFVLKTIHFTWFVDPIFNYRLSDKKKRIVRSAFSISKTQTLQHKLNHYVLKNTNFLYINVFLFLIVKFKTYLILLAKLCRIVRLLFFYHYRLVSWKFSKLVIVRVSCVFVRVSDCACRLSTLTLKTL